MKEPISIKEILAVVIKRGRAILCTAIALAILIGGVKGMQAMQNAKDPANSAENIALRYEEAMAEYEWQSAVWERYIANMELKLAKQQEYNEESLRMQLDPYNKYESHVVLAITEIDELAFQQVYQQQGTPVDYIVSKIQQQYLVYWNNMDVNNVLQDHPYEGVQEKYIRELVSVSETDGGMISISANGATEADAAALCEAVYQSILEIQPTIAAATYAHDLSVISSATKLEVDSALDEHQRNNLGYADTYQQELDEYKQQREALKKPTPETGYSTADIVKTAVKWAIVGGVVGFLMACACVWLWYILRDSVETSRQAEAILGVPFFGSAAAKGNLFVRLANRFVGERQWKDREQAAAYIAENLKSRLNTPERIALVSTLKVEEQDAGIQLVLKAMQEQGHTVIFANNAEENPKAVAAVRECKYVIPAERLGASNRNAMLHVLEQAKQLDAQVLGFITI